MDHVRIRLQSHEVVHRHRPRKAHAPEIIARQIHQHDVLGALLVAQQQLQPLEGVLIGGDPAWAGAGNGARVDPTLLDAHQPLG
jgi:hypothetical protein